MIHRATEDVFDFGITDVLQISRAEHTLFIVQFVCGCTVVVGGGRILLWPGRFAAICEHVGSPPRPTERRSTPSLIPRAASLVESAPMAERTRRRKARSAGSRKTTKRARPKGRAARGKAAKPKKKTVRKRKVAVAARTRPSPRRPAKATAPAPGPEAQAPPAGKRPEVTPSTESVKSPWEPGQTPA